MNPIKELIKKMLLEGKNQEEITLKVLELKEAKDLKGAEIAEQILSMQKATEVKDALALAAKEQKEKDDKAALKLEGQKQIDDYLKTINIQPQGAEYKHEKELKTFDAATGKIISIKHDVSEAYSMFNHMIKAGMKKNHVDAQKISDDIRADNVSQIKVREDIAFKRLEALDIKVANDPLASDVDARGGFAVPTEIEMTLNQLIYEEAVMLDAMNTDNIIYQDKIYPLMYNTTVSYIDDQDTALTESQQVITNPTVDMKRCGTYSNISNTLLRQRGSDFTRAITNALGSAFAIFFDFHLAIGNVSGASELIDGIAFDPNTNKPTPYARTALTITAINTLIDTLDAAAGNDIRMIANRLIVGQVGLMENGAGNLLFPQYVNGGNIDPMGVPMRKNSQITSVLDIGGDDNTGGTDNIILCFSKKHCIAGISGGTEIATSEHWRFSNDVTTIRGIKSLGAKVLSASGGGGIVASVQELTA